MSFFLSVGTRWVLRSTVVCKVNRYRSRRIAACFIADTKPFHFRKTSRATHTSARGRGQCSVPGQYRATRRGNAMDYFLHVTTHLALCAFVVHIIPVIPDSCIYALALWTTSFLTSTTLLLSLRVVGSMRRRGGAGRWRNKKYYSEGSGHQTNSSCVPSPSFLVNDNISASALALLDHFRG